MAVPQQTPRNVSTASAGATVFPYNFKVLSKSDLQVEVNGDAREVDVHFTIDGVGQEMGGNITFLAPMVGGERVMRRRNMAIKRDTDYQNLGDLRSPTLNNDQDEPIMMLQQLSEALERTLTLPPSTTATGELPDAEPFRALVWNEDGTGLANGDLDMTGDMLLRGNLAAPDGAKLVGFQQIGSPVVRSAESRFLDTMHIKDFGGVGDGVADDGPALALAHAAAGGREVLLEGGKTYRITSALVFSDLSLRATGTGKATIFQPVQSYTPLTVQGSFFATRNLTSSVTVNGNGWAVADTTGIVPGMIMVVKSSKSWYHDPRPGSTDARCSELHRVAYVAGGKVYVEDPALDGYNTGSATVELSFYNAGRCRLEGVTIQSVRSAPGPAGTTNRRTGINLIWCDSPVLRDVDVIDCAAAGITLTECYRPLVEGGRTHSANDFGTGYGVQTAGTAWAVVRGRKFWQCRRGVDVSGAQIISRNTLIENCVNYGGGVNSEGTRYGWGDNGAFGAQQHGFGSHGTADNTTYRNNYTADLPNHYTLRGRNEYIEDAKMIGRCNLGLISVGFGENLKVTGCSYYDGWSSLKDGTIFDGGDAAPYRRADWFVKIDGTPVLNDSYEGRLGGTIIIENNAVTVNRTFLYLYTTGPGVVYNNVSVRNNRVRFIPPLVGSNCYLVENRDATTSEAMAGWSIVNNDYQMTGGARLYELGSLLPGGGESVFGPTRTYRLTLADDTATFVRLPELGVLNIARVMVDNGGAVYGCVRVAQNSATTAEFGTFSNVNNVAAGPLTGTTGVDGRLNLNINAGRLFVENRMGSTMTFLVTIMHAF